MEAEIVGQQLLEALVIEQGGAFINYDADDLVLCLSYPKEASLSSRDAVIQHFLVLLHTAAKCYFLSKKSKLFKFKKTI